MRKKGGGQGTFARRMEKALALLLFCPFVILLLHLSITHLLVSVPHTPDSQMSHISHSVSS